MASQSTMRRKKKKTRSKKNNNPHHRRCGKSLSMDESMTEMEGRKERKKGNSLWRKMSIYEVSVKRKLMTQQSAGAGAKMKTASEERNGGSARGKRMEEGSGANGVSSDDVAEDVVDDLLKKMFDRPESNDMPDMTDGEGDEDEDEELDDGALTDVGEDENATNYLVKNVIADMLESLFKEVNTKDMSELSDVDDEDEDVEVARGLWTDTDDECKLSDDEDNDRDEVVPGLLIGTGDESELSDVEDNDESEGPLRMKGGSEVFLTEDLDNYDREELVEYLLALNVKTDLTQNKRRLFDVLQQKQIANFIVQQTPSTIVHVLKRHNLSWKEKKRREATLKMHFLRNPDLQQRILDDIVACSVMSPVSSGAESEGTPKFFDTARGRDSVLSPATPSTASSSGTPSFASPATPVQEGSSIDRLWMMSRSELISFLSEEKGPLSRTNKSTEEYRDRVGAIMLDKLLKELNSDSLLTEVMDKLKIDYRRDLDRRADNLRTHFKKKEDGKKQMVKKQQAVLRELQLAIARKTGDIFTFPSEYNPSDFTPPSLPGTSREFFSKQPHDLQPPPKRRRKQSPAQSFSGTVVLQPENAAVGLLSAAGDEQVVRTAQVRFENPSTYCYLNGLLNLFFTNPEVMRVLFSAVTEQQLLAKGNGSVNILYELRRLFQTPATETGNVGRLKQLLGNQWAEDNQEDAHDLFSELYTRLSCANFEDLFMVGFQTVRQCLGPGCQPVLDVENLCCLLLPPQGNMDMLHLYRSMCEDELIPFNCDCGTQQSNRHKIVAFSGSSMVVLLERYRFLDAQNTVRNDSPIHVPLSMHMNDKQWHLTGALKNSSGLNTTSFGHYTGIRRDLSTGHFFCNNDSAPLERLNTNEAQHFINRSYMIMYCTEEQLPGKRAPPLPVEEEGHGGDHLTAVNQPGTGEVNAKHVHNMVDGAGDGGAPPVKRARKKTAGKQTQARQLADDFHPSEEETAEMREYARMRRVHLEARHERIQRDDFSWQDLPPNPLYENILEMEAELNKFKPVQCSHCKEELFDVKLTKMKKLCPKCDAENRRRTKGEVHMWSAENNMHVDDEVPEVLRNLTPVEQSAIQRMFVVMKIYRVARGATFLKGHCLAVYQDVAEFATRLPLRPADLPMIFLIGPNQRVPLRANAHKILKALQWLKENNEFYRDIEIDFEALKAYPSNDTDYVDGLCTVNSDTIDEQTDPADAYTEEEGADIVYTSIQGVESRATVKEDIKQYVLADENDIPRVEWPSRSKLPADENTRGAFSMMFPWLFPTGKGDITVRGPAGKPQYLAWLQHLLNHESRRFAHDQRFLHYAVNRHQKLQALTLGHCFVKYSSTDITLQELKEQVANDNLSTFSSLLYFARGIVGSRQFFRDESRKSLALVNFIHIMSDMKETMNLFVTLSFADQHDPGLHRLFKESDRYLNKTVVNKLADIPKGGSPDDYILATEDHRLRTEAVENNGDIVCKYLNKKLWLFFEHVLKPMGVIDYILRVEFQYRSSEHFHMVLRLLDGVAVDDVHRAFTLSEFEVKSVQKDGMEKIGKLPPEQQQQIRLDHERALASRAQVADFSTFRIGQTAIHPQKDPKQWPAKEGLNKEKPRVNCLRRQFSDVVEGPNHKNTFSFQVPRVTGGNELANLGGENLLADEATAQRIMDDAIFMVNRTHLHNCTVNYCLKIVVATERLCKFYYPHQLEGFTAEQTGQLFDIVHNVMTDHAGAVFQGNELLLARNHPRLVISITEFIVGWRGNTNTRFVQSVHQLIEYVLKYIMKVTAGSLSFANTVKDITNHTDESAKVSSVFQKLLMRNITEHDLSRTEAFRIALGMDFVFYSRQFRRVNLMGLRMVVKDDGSDGTVRKATKDNRADLYWRRDDDPHFANLVKAYEEGNIVLPWHPREINLYQYVAYFENNWTPSRETYVPLPAPQHKYPPDPRKPKNAASRKDYLQTQLLLFQPGLRPQSLPDDLEAGMREFVETTHCPRLIREAFLKSWEENDAERVCPDPLLDDPELPEEADIEQDPFMAGLAETLTNADRNNVNCVDDEEEGAEGLMRELAPALYTGIATDDTADWSEDRRLLGLDRRQVDEAPQWLEGRKAVTEVPNQVWTEQYEPDDLNPKQREVFDLMERLVMGDEVEPGVHLIDLNGEAGTGKTRLLNTILYQSEIRSGDRSRIRVCAFTNSAAKHFIGGKTAHKLLRLDVERGPKGTHCRRQPPLEGKRLQEFQDDLATTRAIIIDEKSMIGCFDLWRIDQRLRQAHPKHLDKMFGGFVILLCGDLSQLPPVFDKALYYDGTGFMTDAQSMGRSLFRHFSECYFLTESMRQQGPENEMFRGELRRLANGEFNVDDWHRWEKRSLDRLPEEEQTRYQTEGVKLCSRKVDMVTFNEDGLTRCNTPILVIKAVHNNDTAKKASESDGELPLFVPVCKGASVMLTENLWPDMGLINGAKGTVTHIVFQEGVHPANGMPAFILVSFPDYVGPPFVPGMPGTVPICPRTAEWKDGSTRCTRRSFSLIPGFALTIHKSEGMTIEQPVVIDIGPKEFAVGLTYTACTRTRSLENVAFHPMPTFNRIMDIYKDSFKTKQKEVTRRLGLAAAREASEAEAGETVEQAGREAVEAENFAPTVTPAVAGSPPDVVSIEDSSPGDFLNPNQVCIYPPRGEGNSENVYMRDYRFLTPGSMLNDVLVKVGLDFLERDLLSPEQRERLFVFDGRFQNLTFSLSEALYDSAPTPALARVMHARVASITKPQHRQSIDIFSKDIVLWPICRSGHWFLVVGLNLGTREPAIFTLNSIMKSNYGEGAILEHIKAYLAVEYGTLPRQGSQLPHIRSLSSSPPQQIGVIDCGVFVLGFAEAIFRRFDQFRTLPYSEVIGQNWIPSFSPLTLRQRLAEMIRNVSAQQNFGVSSWPDLNLG